jgi:hypothetical protein
VSTETATAKPAKPQPSKKAIVITWACLAFLVIIVISALTGGGKSHGAAPAGPLNVTNASVAAVVTQAINGAETSPGLAKAPSVECTPTHCNIAYVLKEPTGINSELELIQPTAGVYKALFSAPRFQEAEITVAGPTSSVGGKTSESALFSLTCNRAAANQIDWGNVEAKGLMTLCTYVPMASGVPKAPQAEE